MAGPRTDRGRLSRRLSVRMVAGSAVIADILGVCLRKGPLVANPECVKICCPTEAECAEAGICLESCREGDERCEKCPFRAAE